MQRKPKKKALLSDEALEIVATRFKALGDPTRLKLLQALFAGEKTVQELCQSTQLSQANVSKHLGMLAEQGILGRRKEGLYVFYFIADESIFVLCDTVCESLAERFNRAHKAIRPTAK